MKDRGEVRDPGILRDAEVKSFPPNSPDITSDFEFGDLGA